MKVQFQLFKLALACLFTFIVTLSFAQPAFNWEMATDSSGWPQTNKVLSDSEGNIYTCGTHNSYTSIGVTKYDQYGNELWTTLDTMSIYSQQMIDVVLGDDGNIYATGMVRDSTFEKDIFITKFNSSGNKLWQDTYNGSGNDDDQPNAIMYFDNHIYTTGYTTNDLEERLAIIQKHDTSGVLLWTIIDDFDNPGEDAVFDINNDGDNIIITGYSDQQNIINYLFMLAKYDQDGNKIWQEVTDFGFGQDVGMSLDVDSDKNIYVVVSDTQYDLVKYNSNGSFQWFNTASPGVSGSPPSYRKVKVDEYDNIYVSGWAGISGGLDGVGAFLFTRVNASGQKLFNIVGTDPGSASDFDFLSPNDIIILGTIDDQGPKILNFDSLGNISWSILYREDVPYSSCFRLAVDAMDNIIVAGYVRDTTGATPQAVQTIKYGNAEFITGIESLPFSQNSTSFTIDVYPNPAGNSLNISSTLDGSAELRLISTSGKTMILQHSNLKEAVMDLSNVPSGMYFLHVENEEGQCVRKIVKM